MSAFVLFVGGLAWAVDAIVLAQTLLVLPIVAALARQFVEDAWGDDEFAAVQ